MFSTDRTASFISPECMDEVAERGALGLLGSVPATLRKPHTANPAEPFAESAATLPNLTRQPTGRFFDLAMPLRIKS